jgi:site-specific DNA-methyltransferase (adenine-specific)
MIELHNADCLDILPTLADGFVDLVCIDPPYLYLNHKLDTPFDYKKVFSEFYRILKPDGFLVYFGRGVPLAQWTVFCNELGFKFKEELVWNKTHNSNPMGTVMRIHELIMVFSKGEAKLNKVYIDKIDYDLLINPKAIANDLKRIVSKLKSFKNGDEFIEWREGNYLERKYKHKHKITKGGMKEKDIAFRQYQAHIKGKLLSSILCVNREHYTMSHPTQKPVELISHLINLTSNEGDIVLDCFMGSGTTAVACEKLNRNFIGIEKLPEYFEIAKIRAEQAKHNKQAELL